MLRVVLADDVADIRTIVKTTLGLDGRYEVVGEAADGRAAVQLAADLQPDVMILDIAMPVMDGLEAIPQIRDAAPHCRIYVLTGFDTRVGDEALRIGADAYQEKTTTALLDLGDELHAMWSTLQAEEA